ncbi:MAG TPA: NADH dehydrogenase (quinone) subunit D [Candidatus Sulfotelmatobacter sp.]|nr:NADH dehydrogenase (quinone) subunit D [Candidatus Sulfotelmatobacter sp.]
MAYLTPTPVLEPAQDRTMILNMGPQHPSTHGVLRVILEIDGENVIRIMPDIGYLHTGIEKTCEAKFYQQVVPLTDRIDYLCPLTNNLCYCLAVEKLLGMEIPPKAQWLRVLLNELTRINSHLVWLGTHAMDIGAMTVLLYCFREREEILKIFEMASGQRMMTSYFRVGGIALEPPLGFFDRVRDFAGSFSERIDEYENLLTANPIWTMRTKGVATITAEDAIALGCSGPTLRGSGVDFDLRRDMPYSSYEKFQFNVPVAKEGDVFARYVCRVQELRESIGIVRQALDGMPEGPIKANDPKVVLPDREKMKTQMEALIYHFKIITEGFAVPAGEVYQAVESPRGEMGYYIVSDGTAKPYRVHMRAACLANLQALEKMCEGRLIADVVAAIGSIDIVLGEIDR